jgi:hypothetical protein
MGVLIIYLAQLQEDVDMNETDGQEQEKEKEKGECLAFFLPFE